MRAPLALLVLGAGIAVAQAAPRPRAAHPDRALVFDEPILDVGEGWQFGTVQGSFLFTNRGPGPLEIASVHGLTSGARVELPRAPVPPGGRGEIVVAQALEARLGIQRFRFEVASNDPVQPVQRVTLVAFAQSAYDIERPFLNFGYVDRNAGAALDLEIGSRETDRVEFAQVKQAPAFLAVEAVGRTGIADESTRVRVSVRPAAPRGFHLGAIVVHTDVAHQPDYVVTYQAAIYDSVVPEPALLQLGAVRLGQSFAGAWRLVSRGGQGFAVTRAEDPAGLARLALERCAGSPEREDCWTVRFELPGDREGPVDGTVQVFVAGDPEPVPLSYTGLVATADARIEDLGTIDADTLRREVGNPGPPR